MRDSSPVFVWAFMVAALGGCSPGPSAAAPGGLPDRDPRLACALVREQAALLLDVRSPAEFEAGHLEGAVNIPHDQLGGRLDEVLRLTGGDRSRPIVAYCRSGRRSGLAKATLGEAGFSRVSNLGGIGDWTGCS